MVQTEQLVRSNDFQENYLLRLSEISYAIHAFLFRTFPWVLRPFELSPFHFYKV